MITTINYGTFYTHEMRERKFRVDEGVIQPPLPSPTTFQSMRVKSVISQLLSQHFSMSKNVIHYLALGSLQGYNIKYNPVMPILLG